MEESTEVWPVGLRFKPTEDELVGHHLTKKLKGEMEAICVIPELYIYNLEPPELFTRYNELSSIPSDGSNCFFFCPSGRKRKTEGGFWKETSTKRVIQAPDTGEEMGLRRSFGYHKGRQRNSHRTSMGMYQYHLKLNVPDREISDPTAWVLCHITNRKSEKAKSATASTSTDLSGLTNLNDSQSEGTQEISAQASPRVTIEFPCLNETSILPYQNVPILDRQPQTSMEKRFLYDDHRHVDALNDGHHDLPYSPSDGIDLADLINFDESTDLYDKLE